MDDGDGTVGAVHAPEQGKRDGMVTSEGDYTRESLAVLGNAWLFCGGLWVSHQDTVVTLFDLVESPGVVVGCHRDVAAVDDLGPGGLSVLLERRHKPGSTYQSAKGFAAKGTL